MSHYQELRELRRFRDRVTNCAYGFLMGVCSVVIAYALFGFATGG